MQYSLDRQKFKKRLFELGYEGLSDFAKRNKVHRNTLAGLLQGNPVFLPSFRKIAHHLHVDPLELIEPLSSFPDGPRLPNLDEIRPVVAGLVKRNKGSAVLLLGSRARRRAKAYSDWDIGIWNRHAPICGIEYLRLKRFVDEATEDLPRQVDLVNLNQAPSWFLGELRGNIIFLDGDRESFLYLEGVLDGIEKGGSPTREREERRKERAAGKGLPPS